MSRGASASSSTSRPCRKRGRVKKDKGEEGGRRGRPAGVPAFLPLPLSFSTVQVERGGVRVCYHLARMRAEFEHVYERAWGWSRARGFAGHDPFDALNSRVFQATPFRRSRLARLA